jgi:Concanavalin A-like lectin/glucanases superfamily
MAMLGCLSARADVLYYECGEADPGAANGVTATNSLDSAGINDLLLVGGPVYSSDHAPCDTNSSLSLQFNGTNFGLASAFVVTNFTAEVWVKPESDCTYATIFYDGNGEYDLYADYYDVNDLDGWGFLQEGNTFVANLKDNLYGNYDLGSTPVVTNVWTHLALVCTNGVAMFLVNGQTNIIADVSPIPSTESEYLNVAGWSDGTAGFVGLIDDAKVSVSLPLTLTASWSPGQVALYWPSTYPNYCVQYM